MLPEQEGFLSNCPEITPKTNEARGETSASKNTFFAIARRRSNRIGLAATLLISGVAFTESSGLDIPGLNQNVAAADANGYPWPNAVCRSTGKTEGACPDYDWTVSGASYDNRGYSYRNCTSYAAWRVNKEFGVNVSYWGNAATWDDNARRAGYAVDVNGAEAGDLAVWDTSAYGHVAFVESVNSDGSVNVAEYNQQALGLPGTRNNVRANHYIDINGEGKNWVTSTTNTAIPTPNSAGNVPYAAVKDGQEFYSDQGVVYTRAGGSAWPIKSKNEWNSGDTFNWGGNPVGPVSTTEAHDHEAGYSPKGREIAAHPPVDGTTIYEEGTNQQWYFLKGRAYPIGAGELDDLGVRNKALRIPFGRLPDFKYGYLPLENGALYRQAGTARVNQLILNQSGRDSSFYVNNETVLSCLEITRDKRIQIIPQAAGPYLDSDEKSTVASCAFPSGMVLFGPGGIEQWRITGDNSSVPYRRHYFPNALTTYLHTSANPDYRTLRSAAAINNVIQGDQMTVPNGQFFENTSNGDVFKVDSGVFRKVPWPNMLQCLGNPSVLKIPGNVVGALPQGPNMQCNYENRIIVRPDGRAYHIEAGLARPIGNPAIRDCISWFGAGEPINITEQEANSYSIGASAPCPFQRDYGLKFIREEGDPTVWFVENDGLLRHAGSLCVGDSTTTQWKQFRVWTVARGVTHANQKAADWWADGAKCDALPKVWMG